MADSSPALRFVTPPDWPTPPDGWVPPDGWAPDPSWPPAPAGWQFWELGAAVSAAPTQVRGGPETADPPAQHAEPIVVAPAVPGANDLAVDEARRVERHAPMETEPILHRDEGPAAAPEPAPAPTRRSLRDVDAPTDALLPTDVEALEGKVAALRAELVELDDAVLLQHVGIYEYHHPLENAEAYKDRLAALRERIRDANRSGAAILATDKFAYNNSLAQGRKFVADFSKLMLRAYNAEADSCVRAMRAGALQTAVKRLDAAATSIARLGTMMQMRVAPDYHALRLEELELTADFNAKRLEEKELEREERERLREERKVAQELAAQREKLDKQRAHYLNALATLESTGSPDEIADLRARLDQVDDAISQNDYRAANVRAGYVYVISNIGAFGPGVVKIGMTRRLEPMDRVRELGDASVPFGFDVHALFFADDAVTLENELHKAFAPRRVNRVNLRREFFFATPAEVRDVVASKVGSLLEYAEVPEATQYHQSAGQWPAGAQPGPAGASPTS